MWEFVVEDLPEPHTLVKCIECDWRLENALKARDLIAENEKMARELDELRRSEETLLDQGDGFYG
jgi:hypothetical protein